MRASNAVCRAAKAPRTAALLAAALSFCAALAPAAAQRVTDPNVPPAAGPAEIGAIEAERSALFQRMLADPANLDLAFTYAALSARAGDLEGAIATLERMLIFAPGLPRLQLELGVLYFRLGAQETALTYFQSALSAPDVPPEVRLRVEPYLVQIDEQRSPGSFSGAVLFGARYQSNANAAPETRNLTLNGLTFLLSEEATQRADVNGFASANFLASYDLASQGDRIDATLSTYGALYAERNELDTGLAELTVGPTFNLERFRIDQAALGTYAILGGVLLDGDPFLVSGGAGISLAKGFGSRTRALGRIEYRRESFRDTVLRPTSSDRSGDRYRASALLEHQLTSRLTIFGSVDGERREADRGYLSLHEFGVSAGGTYLVPSPLAADAAPWSLSLSGGFASRSFDDPDPIFSRTQAQEDRDLFVQGGVTVPFGDSWAVQAIAGYRDVSSNYGLRDFDNISTTLGILKRF